MRPAWRLRPITHDDFEWAYTLHKAALGEYVERTWGWDERVQRRMFSDSVDDQGARSSRSRVNGWASCSSRTGPTRST